MTATIPLIIAIGSLLAALVLLWIRQLAKPLTAASKTTSASAMIIDLQCDAKAAMIELRAVTAELKLIAALAKQTGVRLDVRQMPQESDRLKPGKHSWETPGPLGLNPPPPAPPRPAKRQAKAEADVVFHPIDKPFPQKVRGRRDGGKPRGGQR